MSNYNPDPRATPIVKAQLTRQVIPSVSIALGLEPGYSSDLRFGRNADVDGAEDIWSNGGDYTGQPAGGSAEAIEMFSSDANDSAGGTGARTVRLFGLDENYDLITEDVSLNGVTGAITTNLWRRMWEAHVLTAGSGAGNAGTLTFRHRITTANIFATVTAGWNHSQNCVFTVPRGHRCVIVRLASLGLRVTATGVADCTVRIRPPGGVYRAEHFFTVGNGITFDDHFASGIVVEEQSDVKIRVESVSAQNLDISSEFEYILIKSPGGGA